MYFTEIKLKYILLSSPEGKESVFNARDPGLIPGVGRSPGDGNGSPFQYSCLKNPIDRGAWQATVPGIARVGHDLVTKSHHVFIYNLAMCQVLLYVKIPFTI